MKSLRKKLHFKEINSTTTFLKCSRHLYRNFTFVSADYQTDGHGRFGRTWHSNKGENLLFSFLINDKKLIEKYSALSICSAVSIFKVLKSYGIENLSIKWPNDVYVGSKKICGILLEGVSTDNQITDIIIGIGVNANQVDFGSEYLTPPTSVAKELNKKINLSKLKRKIYSQLKKDLKSLNYCNDYLLIARENNYLKGKRVYAEIKGEKAPITVIDIADDNSLICEHNGKQTNLFSGEISFHI